MRSSGVRSGAVCGCGASGPCCCGASGPCCAAGAPGRRPPSPPPLRQARCRRPHGSNYSSSPAPLLACRTTLEGHRENTTHASLIQMGVGCRNHLVVCYRCSARCGAAHRLPDELRCSLRPTRKKAPARVLDRGAKRAWAGGQELSAPNNQTRAPPQGVRNLSGIDG